jgi:hypothetical protein
MERRQEMVVEALGRETGDLIILAAMVEEDFTAVVLEGAEGVDAGVGADVGWVEGVGCEGVVCGEG